MLKGVYSKLSYSGKLLLLIVLLIVFLLFASMFGLLCLVPFYGSNVLTQFANPDYSNLTFINAYKFLQIVNMAVGMLLPTLLFIWLTEPNVITHSGLDKRVTLKPLLISAAIVLFTQPLIGFTSEINNALVLPHGLSGIENWMKSMEETGKVLTDAFLSTTSLSGLLLNIFMIALLPAIAEELLFRGVLSKLVQRWSGSLHVAVMVSAIVFSAVHLQFYGFLPRFLLGVMLGYLYLWSGSLWLPIVAHFTNNFLSVIVEYLYRRGAITTNAENFGEQSNVWLVLLSAGLVILLMVWMYIYLLLQVIFWIRNKIKNRK